MSATATVTAGEKRGQVEVLLGDILRHMEYPARLDFKDMPDGGLGVAVHFDGDLPGISKGKRTYLVDCLQFLVNKVVNRPTVEKRWVTLGVDAFPEPRPAKSGETNGASVAAAPAPVPSATAAPVSKSNPKSGPAAPPASAKPASRPSVPARGHPVDEGKLEVSADPVITRLTKTLAEKSAKLGRFYAVMSMSNDDRARALKAGAAAGVTVKAEGEGHWRRLAFVPAKPAPLPKRQIMPDFDDEDE